MTSLLDYELLTNEVFYKCWHIMEYIEKHPDMSALDKEAIKATIMDALVYKGLIDPTEQSLDFDNLCIIDNLEHYKYEKHPNISGIPLWMKEKFREKSLYITGGQPVSIFLARPPSKTVQYCVYDPNTAVSSIFEDATFYNTIYTSPTRGIRIEDVRPFVEVEIDGQLYLVDTLTKRILKSDWFKENYDLEIKNEQKISEIKKEKLEAYKNAVSEHRGLSQTLPFMLLIPLDSPDQAELKYEMEQSKKYYPDEWEKLEIIEKDMRKNN